MTKKTGPESGICQRRRESLSRSSWWGRPALMTLSWVRRVTAIFLGTKTGSENPRTAILTDMNHENVKLKLDEPLYDRNGGAGMRWGILISITPLDQGNPDIFVLGPTKKKVTEFAAMVSNCVNEDFNLRLQVSDLRGLVAQQRHSLEQVQRALEGSPLDSDYD